MWPVQGRFGVWDSDPELILQLAEGFGWFKM